MRAAGGTVVGGIGVVAGVACVVLANVPTINGGTVNPPTMVRSGRLAQVRCLLLLWLSTIDGSVFADCHDQPIAHDPSHRGQLNTTTPTTSIANSIHNTITCLDFPLTP
jgi:acetyl-CoA carboxylase carboxyltransferase component